MYTLADFFFFKNISQKYYCVLLILVLLQVSVNRRFAYYAIFSMKSYRKFSTALLKVSDRNHAVSAVDADLGEVGRFEGEH